MDDFGIFACDVKHERNITNHKFLDNLTEVSLEIMAKQKKVKEPNAFHILNGTLGSFTFYFFVSFFNLKIFSEKKHFSKKIST